MSVSVKERQLIKALMRASKNGNANTVKVLLDKGVPVDAYDEIGWTALMCASLHGHTDVVRMLLDKGARVDITTISTTSFMSALDIDAGRMLQGEGGDDDKSTGFTALIFASISGHIEVVKLLLDRNALIDPVDFQGHTPLINASLFGHAEVVKLLLDRGAQVNFRSGTALIVACRNNRLNVAKVLVDNGADVNVYSEEGCTALMIATRYEHIDIVKLLLDKGAQIDSQESHGITALMIACLRRHKDLVRLLIDCGADIYMEDAQGDSAITLTTDNDIISLLLDLGSDRETESQATSEESKSGGSEFVDNISEIESDSEEEKIEFQAESESEDIDVSEKQLLAAIETAIKEGGTIDHVLFHGVFLGPPRSGKDSLMKRLMGEMPSDISPSTGAVEKVIHVKVEESSITAAMIIDNSLWTRLGYDEEAIQLMKMSSRGSFNSTQMERSTDSTQQETESSMILEYKSISKSEMQENKHCDGILERHISPSQLTDIKNSSEPAKVQQIMPQRKRKTPMEIFKEAMKNKGLKGLKEHLANTHSIYLTNTGGQIEFQELLPLLVSGPSVFFVTFQLHKSITETFSVIYELSDGQSSKSYQSSLSVLESILQTLSSIAAMGTHVYNGLQRKAVPLRPKVFIIGTHKDLLDQKSAKAEIERIDEQLQGVIKSTSHHYKGIIQFASESQMIFAVNNHDPDDLDFQRIRSAVENLAKNSEYRIRSPAHWMIFSLVVRQLQNRVETYDRCYAIAKECGIKDKEEFNQALHFIHTKMGLIRYFPHEELRNLVIVDPQVLFEKVTELIVETFTFEKASSQISLETFKQMGIFSLNDLERSGKQSDQKLTPVLFAELLGHLRIAARFKQDGVVKFFLPCALAHATEKHADHCTDIPKLLVTFKCGYCPKGLPGSLITYLMTNEMKSKFEWELMTKQIHRNKVSFQVGPHDTIILRIQPTHLEITCTPILSCPSTKRICTVEQVCKEVRHSIDTGIKIITSAINYVDAKHSFTFYCTLDSCSNHPHPAKAFEHEGKFGSLKCELKNQPVPLPSKYENWQFDSTSEERLNRNHVLYLICYLINCAANWREIDMYLGFDQKEMNNISAQPLLLNGAPCRWLFTLLSEWMEWAPEDYRGSTKYANLSDLKSAVSQAGFGVIASKLSLRQETAGTNRDSKLNMDSEINIQTNYYFSAEKVNNPDFLGDVEDMYCDSSGLEHKIDEYDITVKIAEGSLPKGRKVHLKVGASLNGPFKSSSGKRPISPILWLCPEGKFELSKPIEVVLPHILTNVTTEDIENFGIQVAKATHKVTPSDDYILKSFEVNRMKFESSASGNYAVIELTHCCFICLEAYRREQMTPEVAQAMAKRMGYCMHCIECFQPLYLCSPPKEVIYFCVSFFLKKCIKAVEVQYPEKNNQGKLIHRVHRLQRFTMDGSSIELKYFIERTETSMVSVALSKGKKIAASTVDFWESRLDIEEMKLMHNKKLYPPSIEMIVQLSTQVQSQRPKLSVSFEGCIDENGVPQFQFILPIVGHQSGQQHSPTLSCPVSPSNENASGSNIITPAKLDESLNEHHLCSILRQLKEHASQWRKIGCELGFRKGELDNIEAMTNKTAEDLLCAMLSVWLQWAPRDSRGSTEYATLRALRRAVDNAGFGRTAGTLSVTAEANTQCHASTERDESAEEPRPKRPH